MGCATSLCSYTQTAVATVTPRALSSTHVRTAPNVGPGRRSAGSVKSRLSPSVVSVDKKSSQWSNYDLEIRDFDEFSDGDPIRGPCEIDTDDEDGGDGGRSGDRSGCYDHHLIERYTDLHHHQHHHRHRHRETANDRPGVLGENSKWTVTVRLYAQKTVDQRSFDIPSVEETGSHYSSGEWPGKSSSSQGSRGSASRPPVPPTPNGIVPKEYQKTTSTSQQGSCNNKINGRAHRLHHSNSERPLTKEELAQHEKLQQQAATNTTYAWGRGSGSLYPYPIHNEEGGLVPGSSGPQYASESGLNGLLPLNGLAVTAQHQKYEPASSFSTYLSLGTNYYRQARSSLRGSNRRKGLGEEHWDSICDHSARQRPRSSHPSERQDRYRVGASCDGAVDWRKDARGTDGGEMVKRQNSQFRAELAASPVDSLITDYLADTDIMEDLSGSTHSLTHTSGKGTSVSTSMSTSRKGSEQVSPFSDELGDPPHESADHVLNLQTQIPQRPRAALRRHRSEPFHFLV